MRYATIRVAFLVSIALSAYCFAQLGGNIGGIPFPRKGKKSDKTKKQENQQAALRGVRGMLRKLDSQSLVLEADDKRILRFRAEAATIYFKGLTEIKPETIEQGDHLLVEFGEDDDGRVFRHRASFASSPLNRAARISVNIR